MNRAGLTTRVVALAGLFASLTGTPAQAGCYDILGCSDRQDFALHFGDYLVAADGLHSPIRASVAAFPTSNCSTAHDLAGS